MNNDFETALQEWLKRASAIATSYKLEIDPRGKKYIRITMQLKKYGGQVSVFCFIEKSTGNVLKAATYRTPAAHPRGNIYEVGKEGVSEYGALYLK